MILPFSSQKSAVNEFWPELYTLATNKDRETVFEENAVMQLVLLFKFITHVCDMQYKLLMGFVHGSLSSASG
jgi:hypothetical protein